MNTEILKLIGELDDFFYLDQPEEEKIEIAEHELGLTFSEEYKDYVRTGGAICGGGIELTGITDFERLNVVAVTKKERVLNPLIPNNMYVVEVVGIDRMVVLQDETGVIYTAQPGLYPKKLFNSLYEYIKNVGRFSPNENARSGFYYDNCDEFGQDLLERIENGLIPILPSGKMIHLHHMGLSQKMPIDISPLVEFESEYYAQPKVFNTLFVEFDGETNYDRLTSIRQKQQHWNKRSESKEISFNI